MPLSNDSETFENIAVSHILLKLDSLNYIFFRRQYGLTYIFNFFYVIGLKSAEFSRTTQTNSHYAVQGHSRSAIWYQSKPMQLLISD